MRSAMAASATAIGSCAWTTSGCTSREHLAELPGRVDVELAARAEADEPQPLLRAPFQLAGLVRDEHRRRAQLREPGDELAAPGSGRPARSPPCRCGRDRHGHDDAGVVSRTELRRARRRPELRELQEHVVRVHRRDDEAGSAVADAAPQHVVAQERRRRMQREIGQPPPAGPLRTSARPPASCTGPSSRGGGDVAVGEVLQVVAQLADRAVGLHRFVDAAQLPARAPPVVEAQLVVGVPVGRANPAAEVPGHARNANPATAGSPASSRPDAARQLGRDALVGVNRQNPVVGGLARRRSSSAPSSRASRARSRARRGPGPDRRCRRCCRCRRRASRRPRRPTPDRRRCWPPRSG